MRYIGRIAKIVNANIVNGGLDGGGVSLTQDEEGRITHAIINARNIPGYDITTEHRFFLVKEFYETSFEKISPGGLQNQRYFDLASELELDDSISLPPVEEIAELLRGKTWR